MIKSMLWILYIVLSLITILLGVIYFMQEKLIFFPEKVPVGYQYTFTQPFSEVFLPAPDGARLHALHFSRPQAKGVILYFHGNAGSLRSWGYVAEDLRLFGYDVFMPDYRSFGKSTGKLSQQALYLDAQLAYDYVRQQYPENQIIVYGRSVGTGVATKVASENKPKLLLLESPFYNFADVGKTHYPFLLISLLLKYSFRSDKYLPKVTCPTYMFHGTADEIVPFASGLKLAQLLKQPSSFIAIEGGGHNNLSNFATYQQALQRILQ